MKRLAAFCVAVVLSFAASIASAEFHLYVIEQVYSSADRKVQFVVLVAFANGEHRWAGHALTSSGPGGPQQSFNFSTDLPSFQTSGRRVLVATQSFAALGLVMPDYVIPDGFLQTPAGTVDFAGVYSVTYAALPADGVHAINGITGAVVDNVATNFAGQSASVALPGAAANYQGLWWKSPAESESGWGINFAHQGDVIFMSWFTYDTTGKAWWLTMTATKTAEGVYGGTIYRTNGPPFSAVPFNPAAVTATPVGTGTLTFNDASNGSFSYTVNGVSQTKPITRQVFGTLPTCVFGAQPNLALATNYQDLWYAAPAESEAGWGVNFTHQGDIIFATWFTYDVDGTPLWLSATIHKSGPTVFTGTLYRTTGPPFSAVPFLPANVTATPVGTLTLTFANGNSASFAYTVALNGPASAVSQTKAIVRQVFRVPGTVCQ